MGDDSPKLQPLEFPGLQRQCGWLQSFLSLEVVTFYITLVRDLVDLSISGASWESLLWVTCLARTSLRWEVLPESPWFCMILSLLLTSQHPCQVVMKWWYPEMWAPGKNCRSQHMKKGLLALPLQVRVLRSLDLLWLCHGQRGRGQEGSFLRHSQPQLHGPFPV